ncbi:MAG: DUF192 domain-containing protein [Candidatus Andersenbacteria bacterium]
MTKHPTILSWPLTSARTSGHETAVMAGLADGAELTLAIADTDSERQLGLGNRDQLPHDGMLFVFDQPARYGIWMKGMRFPIDIVWLRNGEVVHVVQDAQPQQGLTDAQLPIFSPPSDADAVVELASGRATQLKLSVGWDLEVASLQ